MPTVLTPQRDGTGDRAAWEAMGSSSLEMPDRPGKDPELLPAPALLGCLQTPVGFFSSPHKIVACRLLKGQLYLFTQLSIER